MLNNQVSGFYFLPLTLLPVTIHRDENTSSHDPAGNTYRRVRPSLGVHMIPDGTPMVVVKCPTYYAGDIRILKQRHIPELEHLVDVVVFPVENLDRPHPHEIHERYVRSGRPDIQNGSI